MNKDIKEKVARFLQSEADSIQSSHEVVEVRLEKLNDILHLLQVLDHYDELEPMIANNINEIAQKAKYSSKEDR